MSIDAIDKVDAKPSVARTATVVVWVVVALLGAADAIRILRNANGNDIASLAVVVSFIAGTVGVHRYYRESPTNRAVAAVLDDVVWKLVMGYGFLLLAVGYLTR
jgi:hypothetical protein